jgi:hypothetical protein
MLKTERSMRVRHMLSVHSRITSRTYEMAGVQFGERLHLFPPL